MCYSISGSGSNWENCVFLERVGQSVCVLSSKGLIDGDTISLGLSLDAWNQTQACLCSLFPTGPVYHQSNRYSASIWTGWFKTMSPGKTQRICVLIGLLRFSNQMSPVWTIFLKRGRRLMNQMYLQNLGFFLLLLVHKRYIIYIGDVVFISEHLSDP